nr:MAG TPA: DNA-binding protein [Caudoviricetes sp.]
MKLGLYLKKQKISQAEFGKTVGVTQGFISQVIADEIRFVFKKTKN